ncbi:hypothetical protein ACXHQ9_10890 [Vibrio cincinnatiensis]
MVTIGRLNGLEKVHILQDEKGGGARIYWGELSYLQKIGFLGNEQGFLMVTVNQMLCHKKRRDI